MMAVPPGTRRNIHDLSSAARTRLRNAILAFITQPILAEHACAHDWHHPAVGSLFFSRHHTYLNKLEAYLKTRPAELAGSTRGVAQARRRHCLVKPPPSES